MIVCHCNIVTDRKIRDCVRNGAVDLADVTRASGAGAHCGGCTAAVEQVIEAEMLVEHSMRASRVGLSRRELGDPAFTERA